MHLNRRAFTLIEMLATIIILGLLVSLVYISVRSVLDRGNDSYYNSQENMLILAGREYFADYRSKLPKEIGETSTVPAKTLIDESYIDPIKDKDGNDCDFVNSGVTVQKITEKDYQYYSILKCSNYETEKDKEKPMIAFSPNTSSSNSSITVTMSITDNVEVTKYRYVIEKDGETYQDSGYQTYDGDITINLTELGSYRITGYAIDNSNNLSSEKSGEYIISDTVDCSSVSVSSEFEENTWYNKDITLNIKVPESTFRYEISTESSNGERELINTYIGSTPSTVTIKKEGVYNVKVELFDKYGNSCVSTSEAYKIDRTPPICSTVTGASTTWTSQDRYISVLCKDDIGECANNSYNKTFSKEGKTGTIDIYDKAGNTTSCTVDKYIDKTLPKVISNNQYTSGAWSYFGWIITDDVSGIDKNTSYWEYCYTGHNYDTCGATCSIPNQYSHYPSSIFGDKYKYYYQYTQYPSVESGVQASALAHVNANCVKGHSVRTNFRLCDYAGNCLFNENTMFNF